MCANYFVSLKPVAQVKSSCLLFKWFLCGFLEITRKIPYDEKTSTLGKLPSF